MSIETKCIQCKKELEGRKDAKFCSHSCRGTWHTQMKRMRKNKDYFKEQLEKAKELPSEYSQDFLDLYKKVYGSARS